VFIFYLYRRTASFRLFDFAKSKITGENGKDPSSSSRGLARADYGKILSYSARGLFSADVLPTSAICRPVEACETAATRIAEDEKHFQRSFCSFFFYAARKRRSFPRCAGNGNPSVAPRQLPLHKGAFRARIV